MEGDLRLIFPRFSEENFPKNLVLVDQLNALAKEIGITAAQLAIAWILAENPTCKQSPRLLATC